MKRRTPGTPETPKGRYQLRPLSSNYPATVNTREGKEFQKYNDERLDIALTNMDFLYSRLQEERLTAKQLVIRERMALNHTVRVNRRFQEELRDHYDDEMYNLKNQLKKEKYHGAKLRKKIYRFHEQQRTMERSLDEKDQMISTMKHQLQAVMCKLEELSYMGNDLTHDSLMELMDILLPDKTDSLVMEDSLESAGDRDLIEQSMLEEEQEVLVQQPSVMDFNIHFMETTTPKGSEHVLPFFEDMEAEVEKGEKDVEDIPQEDGNGVAADTENPAPDTDMNTGRKSVTFIEEPQESAETLEDRFVETVEEAYAQEKTIRTIGQKMGIKSFESLGTKNLQDSDYEEVEEPISPAVPGKTPTNLQSALKKFKSARSKILSAYILGNATDTRKNKMAQEHRKKCAICQGSTHAQRERRKRKKDMNVAYANARIAIGNIARYQHISISLAEHVQKLQSIHTRPNNHETEEKDAPLAKLWFSRVPQKKTLIPPDFSILPRNSVSSMTTSLTSIKNVGQEIPQERHDKAFQGLQFDALRNFGCRIKPLFDRLFSNFFETKCKDMKVRYVDAPLKRSLRGRGKIAVNYGLDSCRCVDVVRSTVSFEDIDEMYQALVRLLDDFNLTRSPLCRVIDYVDRYQNCEGDEKYGDIKLIFLINNYACELQIHHEVMLEAKHEAGHKTYVSERVHHDGVLYGAMQNDFAELISNLEEGGDPTVGENCNGLRALHYAAFWGNPHAVQLLIAHLAMPEHRDSNGNLPVTRSIFNDDQNTTQLLIREMPILETGITDFPLITARTVGALRMRITESFWPAKLFSGFIEKLGKSNQPGMKTMWHALIELHDYKTIVSAVQWNAFPLDAVKSVDDKGNTILLQLFQQGLPPVVGEIEQICKLLIIAKADPFATDDSGTSVLDYAAGMDGPDDKAAVDYVLSHGASFSVIRNFEDCAPSVATFLRLKYPKILVSKQAHELNLDLLDAVSFGNIPSVKTLVAAGADPNCMNKFQSSLLHECIENLNKTAVIEMVKLLLELKCVPDRERGAGTNYRPLHLAAKYGRSEVVHLLLEAKANINAQAGREGSESTPFTYAFSYRETSADHQACVELFAEHPEFKEQALLR